MTKKIQLRLTTPVLILLLFSFHPFLASSQQNLENLNQALRYSRYSRVSPKIIPVDLGERTFLLQMPVEKIEEEMDIGNYSFSYAILGSYQEPITDDKLISLGSSDIMRETDYHYYFEKRVSVPQSMETATALIQVIDNRQGDAYYYHTDLISPFVFGHSEYWAFYGDGIPMDQNYLSMKEPLEFRGRTVVNLHSFFYPATFDVPFPPMEIRPAPVPREIQVDYKGTFLANLPKTFDQEGYYFIQGDTNSTRGVMLKTVGEVFPRVKDYGEMAEKVVYISTRREHEALLEAEDKKKALDAYFYNLTKDTIAAKRLIREYFKQVEYANILFTDFREGWKTDRGMIYIVMGPPNEVSFRPNGEIWSYVNPDTDMKITFTFARVKNILTPNFYTLNRSRALQPEWFKSITAWRNAQINF